MPGSGPWRGSRAQPNWAGGPGHRQGARSRRGRPPRTPGPCLIPGPQLEWDPPRTGAPLYPSPGTDPAPPGAPFPSKTCRASWTGPHSNPLGLGCQGGCPLLLGAFSLPSARELRALRQPSCRDLTLGLWADRGALVPCITSPELAGCLPRAAQPVSFLLFASSEKLPAAPLRCWLRF